MRKAWVRVNKLRKSFGSVEVLKGVDLEFHRGEIHAFIGANGAGKSTLLGCLSGAVEPSGGTIVIGDEELTALTPRLAIEKGIGIIYQHFQVVEGLTVADNIFLGSEIHRFGIVARREQEAQARKLLERLGVEIDARRLLDELSVGERQLVEIARALHIRPDLLILDEPTAALSDREIEALHKVVQQLAHRENIAIVYVTHLLDEIEAIADVVTVLRDGATVWTRPAAEVTPAIIAQGIAPSAKLGQQRAARVRSGESQMRLQDYRCDYTGPIDLDLHKGEIVGLYGLLGSGRTDLVETLAGARPCRGGVLTLRGQAVSIRNARRALEHGIALVASDRNEQSLFRSLPALDNLLMPHFDGLARRRSSHRPLFRRMAEALQLHPARPDLEGGRFSGGNAQKLVMGRWLLPELDIRVLLLDEPTQGVDIGARAEIYRLLEQFADGGGAVLVASSDPQELVELCDRVLVLGQGRQIELIEDGITPDRLVEAAHKSFSASLGPRSRLSATA
ncbi:MAG: sugar ABC transporter ATP-binding protein [Rhizobiaceae bacterium]|nr:sugar ABC transporter ATP-binding protein [Rhizobiaceae bacterium]